MSEDQKMAEIEIEDKCKVCGEICTCEANQNTLNRRSQVQRTEQAERKPFECVICKKKFSRSNHLKSHILTHTGEKPFKCEICSKGFTRSGILKKHMLSHTSEKQFKC